MVDGCSTDLSSGIIQKNLKLDRRIKYFKTLINSGGLARPKNIGLAHFQSFVDQDDKLLPNKLEIANRVFTENPEFDVIFWGYIPFGDTKNNESALSSNFLGKAGAYLETTEAYNLCECVRFYGCMAGILTGIVTQTIVLKKGVFKNIQFDTRYKIVDDISVWYRFTEKFRCAYYDSSVALYRYHDKVLTINSSLLADETLSFHSENYYHQYKLLNKKELNHYKSILARFYVRRASQKNTDAYHQRFLLFNALYLILSLGICIYFLNLFCRLLVIV
ncbi:MAG: hypothetical protein JNIBNLAF_02494 [Nitrosomonas europaea]|nr:hypothetical protein [Nitrosomonas europaea]